MLRVLSTFRLVSSRLGDVEAPDVYRGRKQGCSAYTAHKAASSSRLTTVDVDATTAQGSSTDRTREQTRVSSGDLWWGKMPGQ